MGETENFPARVVGYHWLAPGTRSCGEKCPATKVFLVHLRLQERKAVERVTGICRIGSGWYVGWLYAAKNVLARKCCGAAGGAAGAPPGKLGSAQDDKEGARQTLRGE